MSQLQVYSSNFPLHYLFSSQIIVIIKVIIIGFILVGLLLKIQKQIKIYIDTINLLEYMLNEINKKYDSIYSENNTITSELTCKITTCSENIRDLENNLSQINNTIALNDKLIENACSSLHSQISNNRILIGYRMYSHEIIVPVFETIDASTIFDQHVCDCFIVNQFKYFKNIKQINLMTAIDKMFIFGNTELHKLLGSPGSEDTMSNNVMRIVEENNPNYFVVSAHVFGGFHDGRYCCLFKQPYNVQMYAKNNVKKLYEQLKEMDIELTMPDELRDYCLSPFTERN